MRKKNKKKELSFVKKNLILIFCCLTLVCFMSIGYSALNQTLFITGEVALRAVKDIRISDLRLTNISNGGYENYNSNFTINSISLSAHLPNVGSSVTYEATIKNKGTVPMEVSELTGSTSVSGVSYKIDGLEVGTVTEAGSTTTFTITLTRTTAVTTTDDSVSSLIELEWIEEIPALYIDPILAGNDPNLLNDSLVPVVYSEKANKGNGGWIVANLTDEWYNYNNQQWANAVILKDGVKKNPGDVIIVPTADSTATEVRAMYVWIPRYEYKIEGQYGTHTDGTAGTAELPGKIEVNFIPTTQTSASSGYILHPAFQWDTDSNGTIIASEHISGIWVGKFLASPETSSTCYSESLKCDNTSQTPYILPNVKSLLGQSSYNKFTTAKKFSSYLKTKTNVDSHMMKNSEWGAVAYLSQSLYGKYGNSSYTGANKEVYTNNTGHKTITGRSSGSPVALELSDSGTYTYDIPVFQTLYERISGMEIIPTVINDTSYPWIESNEIYKSDVVGQNDVATNLTFTFSLPQSGNLYFEWSIGGGRMFFKNYQDYAYYTITKNGNTLSDTGVITQIGGSHYGKVESELVYLLVNKELEAGDYEITFTHQKGTFGPVVGTDTVYVKNISAWYGEEYDETVIYNKENGVGASTTGNIYGVYDMAGTSEFVMTYISSLTWDENGAESETGWTSAPDKKYYDHYTSSDLTRACSKGICYGHALSETLGWYGDSSSSYESNTGLFLARGNSSSISSLAGIFSLNRANGWLGDYNSFRSVLLMEG